MSRHDGSQDRPARIMAVVALVLALVATAGMAALYLDRPADLGAVGDGGTGDVDDAPTASPTVPEPTPAPTGEPGPTPTPGPTRTPGTTDRASWPGPETTGVPAGTQLEPSGPIRTEVDGQVIEGLEVSGVIEVMHRDVTIRNTRVLADGDFGIRVPIDAADAVENLLIEDVELVGVAGRRAAGLAGYGDWTARRIQVSGFEDGVKMQGQQLLDSWIRDDYLEAPEAHNDGVQADAGSGAVIRGNRIDGPGGQTSAVLIKPDFGAITDYVLADNWLSGGNYTVFLREGPQGLPGVAVRDNVFVRDSAVYGPYSIDDGAVTDWSGNRMDDGEELGAP